MSNLATLPSQKELTQGDTSSEFTSDDAILFDFLSQKSKSTAKTYLATIREFQRFNNNTPIALWTKQLIKAWLYKAYESNKLATVNKKLTGIRSFLSHCVREDYLEKNVAANIPKFKGDEENLEKQSKAVNERIIGTEEVWDLINSASSERDRLLLKITYLLGLRAHEAVKIHWEDITPDGDGFKLRIIGKNAKLAFLPIHRELVEEMASLSQGGYIFNSRNGGKLTTTQFYRIVKKSAKNAGLSEEISPHYLRHQRCSDLINSGKYSLSQVQTFMRHSSPNITSTYIHLKDEIGSDALL